MEGEREAGEEGEPEGNHSSRLRIRAAKTPAAKEDEGGKKSRGHKRKAEVNLEKLYLQENLKELTSTPLETIFESPRPQKKGKGMPVCGEQEPGWDAETVNIMAAKKLKRICNFPSLYCPSKLKTKQRKDRAKRMKQLTGVRVPRGSKSLEEVMAALACLSDEEQQIENNQNINNRSFSSPPSSEFYSGNILRPDTSEATMDYVIHNMSTLNVALPDTHTSDGNVDIRDMVIPQELLLEDLLSLDEPSRQKKVSRDKKVRRRSGRVTAILPGSSGLSYTSEEQPSLINSSFEDILDPDDEPWEPKRPLQDNKLRRRSGRVTICHNEGRRLSPTTEEPTAHSGSILKKKNTSCDDPPLSCFPETLPVRSEDVPVLATQNTNVVNPTGSTLKPVKKRESIWKTKETSEESSLKDVPRVLAKERTKQRKPKQDISKIAKKAQKLDLGQKRDNSVKTENATVKKQKTSRMITVGKSKSDTLRDLMPELNPISDKKLLSDSSLNAVLHPNLLMCAGEAFSSSAQSGKDNNLGCETGSTGKKGRKPIRSKRRVSGVKRLLYRITKTKEETPDSSPNVHKSELSAVMDTPSPSIISPECMERCPRTPDTLLQPVNLKNAGNDQSASESFSLKDSGTTLWQSPFTAATSGACAMKAHNLVSATMAVDCGDSSFPAGQDSSCCITASPTIPLSSSVSYSTSLYPQISTTFLSYTTTTTTSSSCHVTTDDFTVIHSPTSPSAKLAALSLHTDLPPTPTKSSSVQKAKNKSRRRSSRISLDRSKLDMEKQDDSHFGSFWADKTPVKFNIGHINPETADSNAATSIAAAALRIVSKSVQKSVTGSESVIKEGPVIAQATQKAETCKSEEPKQKRKGRPPGKGISRVKTTIGKGTKIKNHSSPPLSSITKDHLNIVSVAATAAAAAVVPGKDEEKETFPLQSTQTFAPPSITGTITIESRK